MWRFSNVIGLATAVAVLAAGLVAWRLAFFVAPFAWTGEPARLAAMLGIQPGMHIADIGAGSGDLALAMREFVGRAGRIYPTELSPERRAEIARRVARASAGNVHLVTAADAETGLPDGCCHAVYMRAVFHHIAAADEFAADVARVLRPGGRVAVIDFAPGALWFHGADHGTRPDSVVSAFESAGLRLRERVDQWGGGMYLLVFEETTRFDVEPQ